MDLLTDLKHRGLFHSCTDEARLRERLNQGPITVFCGFDPTAISLHVGHLLALRLLRLFQLAGHQVIALVGGATGMIGDPSGRRNDRTMLTKQVLDQNAASLHRQVVQLLPNDGRGPAPIFVDNRDWLMGLGTIAFLDEVGRHFRVNEMLRRDSVKLRLEDGGMSFTELAYSLLQARDFEHLRRTWNCELQIGGSDQWSNILSGIELMRRREAGEGFGLTWPLLTKRDGEKFGKSVSGAVWLDPKLTNPFEFFQFWMHVDDADVNELLRKFTDMPNDVIETAAQQSPQARQLALAQAMTNWVHGWQAAEYAHIVSDVLFGKSTDMDTETCAWLLSLEHPPCVFVSDAEEEDLATLSARAFSISKSEARRLIGQHGLRLQLKNDTETERTYPNLNRALERDGFALLCKGGRERRLVLKRP